MKIVNREDDMRLAINIIIFYSKIHNLYTIDTIRV